MIHFQDI